MIAIKLKNGTIVKFEFIFDENGKFLDLEADKTVEEIGGGNLRGAYEMAMKNYLKGNVTTSLPEKSEESPT